MEKRNNSGRTTLDMFTEYMSNESEMYIATIDHPERIRRSLVELVSWGRESLLDIVSKNKLNPNTLLNHLESFSHAVFSKFICFIYSEHLIRNATIALSDLDIAFKKLLNIAAEHLDNTFLTKIINEASEMILERYSTAIGWLATEHCC